MKIYFKSFCKCFGLFNEEPKNSQETIQKDEDYSVTINNPNELQSEPVFRVKEIRQRSVDYVIHSPRFGNPNLPDCTGGTDNTLSNNNNL
jgi:hypothetical protein